jgi:hypothetical protein
MLQISFTFNQALIFCINPHAMVLINQYSTGLFVSNSTHRKIQLQEKIFKTTVFSPRDTLVCDGILHGCDVSRT